MDQFWPGACQARFAGPPSAKQLKELVHARILNALHVQHGGLRMMQARWDGWPGSFWKSLEVCTLVAVLGAGTAVPCAVSDSPSPNCNAMCEGCAPPESECHNMRLRLRQHKRVVMGQSIVAGRVAQTWQLS
eukprot:1149522-Pelagomonas_calceolata.AAC.2